MPIDIREAIDAAATKPYGFMRLPPGPGMGGHCLPVKPFGLCGVMRGVLAGGLGGLQRATG